MGTRRYNAKLENSPAHDEFKLIHATIFMINNEDGLEVFTSGQATSGPLEQKQSALVSSLCS